MYKFNFLNINLRTDIHRKYNYYTNLRINLLLEKLFWKFVLNINILGSTQDFILPLNAL